MTKRKLLLLGWDAADWKSIHPLMDQGLMPNLEKLVNMGVSGRLATMDPPLSPMLWTSIATGKRPYKHGIHGFTEVVDGNKIRPVYGSSRKVRTFWDILSEKGLKTHVVGWWPSHPAEKVNGISISNFYQKAKGTSNSEWEMLPHTVYPSDKHDFFEDIRIHPHSLTQAHLFPFIPYADKLDQNIKANQQKLHAVRKILAETATIHNAGTYILENEDWDVAAIYFDGIDHFGHGFMKYNPPKMDKVSQEDYEMWKDVVKSGYLFHDMMLGKYMELAGDATIMLISDHGFHPGHLRPKTIPVKDEHAAPAIEHSPFGIICVAGEGIKKDEVVYGCGLIDITPTILQLFNLPIGKDMDGKVLQNIFSNPEELTFIDSWDNLTPYNDLTYESADPESEKKVLDHLVELGYIEKPSDDLDKAAKNTADMNRYFLARSYMDASMYPEAADLLKELWDSDRSKKGYALNLAKCYSMLQQLPLLKEVMEDMIERNIEDTSSTHIIRGNMLMKEHKFRSALKEFKLAEDKNPDIPKLYFQIGNGYLSLKQYPEAKVAFEKEIQLDPENPHAHYGLGITYNFLNNIERSAESFLSAVGLMFNFPAAHYKYGEVLLKLGLLEEAAQAFEVALNQAPSFNTARMQLIQLYKNRLDNPQRAEELNKGIDLHSQGEIVIVSGLPRSGTSMMMQMLNNGGILPYTDNKRKEDESNPKGYFEHEAVKSLADNKEFLFDVGDKAVKVIAQLLQELPFRFKYKVIFMNRDLNEVINSQHTMIARMRKKQEGTMYIDLERSFKNTLKKVGAIAEKRTNFKFLFLDYDAVIRNPENEATKVAEFLGGTLNIQKMAAVVDPSLYREKSLKT